MAKEASTRTDADTRLLSRIPSLLAPHAGGPTTSLNRILAETAQIYRIETPGIRKDHFEFTSSAGDARIMLVEDTLPGGQGEASKQVSLVGLWLTPRTPDGYEANIEVWYTGEHGLPGYFEGTNTQMHLSVTTDDKRSSAMLIIDTANTKPARICSQRLGMQEAVMKEDCALTLPGEQKDPLGVHAYEDVTLLGVEGFNTPQGFLAFNIMGKNKEGAEKPIPVVIPKQVTVC